MFPILAVMRGDAMSRQKQKAKAPAPPATDSRKFARVFMNGRSQAVRLPKEFRFDTDRVLVRREGRDVVLSPMFKDWDDYFRNSTPLPDDFEAATPEMRKGELPLEDREPFD